MTPFLPLISHGHLTSSDGGRETLISETDAIDAESAAAMKLHGDFEKVLMEYEATEAVIKVLSDTEPEVAALSPGEDAQEELGPSSERTELPKDEPELAIKEPTAPDTKEAAVEHPARLEPEKHVVQSAGLPNEQEPNLPPPIQSTASVVIPENIDAMHQALVVNDFHKPENPISDVVAARDNIPQKGSKVEWLVPPAPKRELVPAKDQTLLAATENQTTPSYEATAISPPPKNAIAVAPDIATNPAAKPEVQAASIGTPAADQIVRDRVTRPEVQRDTGYAASIKLPRFGEPLENTTRYTFGSPKNKAIPAQKSARSLVAPVEALKPLQNEALVYSPLPADAEPSATLRVESAQATTHLHTATLPQRPDLPTHVARQIATALQQMPGQPVEISLNPEELGRVRLGVTQSETGIVVNVLAERAETVELMRRHISSLETSFLAIGYTNVSFSFAAGADQGKPQDAEDDHHQTHADSSERQQDHQILIQPHLSPSGGLDIRL